MELKFYLYDTIQLSFQEGEGGYVSHRHPFVRVLSVHINVAGETWVIKGALNTSITLLIMWFIRSAHNVCGYFCTLF
jgi:hypothetical protein